MDQSTLDQFARRQLWAREWTSDVKNTAQSFKSWDTCMDNKACKIIAIVGIVLASIFAIYLIGGVLYFFKSGVTNITEFFCWCCACGKKSKDPTNQNYQQQQQPPMVVFQPIRDPDPGYGGYRGYKGERDSAFYDERLSTKSDIDLEQSFDLEAQRNPWKNNKQNKALRDDDFHDDEIQLETYHPNMVKPTYDNYNVPSPSHSPTRDRYYHGGAYQNVPTSNENPFYQNTAYYPEETTRPQVYPRYS